MRQKRRTQSQAAAVVVAPVEPAEPAVPVEPAVSSTPPASKEPQGPWRLVSVAAVMVVVLVAGSVFLHLQRQLAELRGDLGKLNKDLRKDVARVHEGFGGLVKKNEHDSRVRLLWDAIKELRADRSDLTVLKERCSVMLETLRNGDEAQKQLAGEVRRIREQHAGKDERQALLAEIRAIRERIAGLEGRRAQGVPAGGHAEESEQP